MEKGARVLIVVLLQTFLAVYDFKALANLEGTLLPTQMFHRLLARATFVADTNFVFGTQKMFLILFRNILCSQQMFPSFRSPRTSWATMCPRLNTMAFLQRTAKKCTKSCNARAEPLFGSLDLLFSDVLVAFAVAVVIIVNSLLFSLGQSQFGESSFGIFRNKNIFRLFCSSEQNSRNGNPGIPE